MSESFYEQYLRKIEQELEQNDITEKEFEQRKAEQQSSSEEDPKYYFDNTPIELDIEKFKVQMYDWFSNIAAVDLISTKNIDVFISDEEFNLKELETFNFDKILKKNNLEIKIYDLAKRVSLAGIGALWFEPIFGSKEEKYSLNSQVNIIQMKVLNNEIQKATFLVNLVRGIAVGGIYAMVEATKTDYKTRFYQLDKGTKFPNKEKIKNIDDFKSEFKKYEKSKNKIKESLANDGINELIDYINQEHNLGFVPIFPLFFNESYSPIIRNIEQDLDELFSLATKKYDESHLAGSKVIQLNNSSTESNSNVAKVQKNRKLMASSSVLVGNDDMDIDKSRVSISVETKPPIWTALNDAYKQKLNMILKSIGLSSDTDSKGTVQQSIGEIVKQNEYSYNNQNYRNVVLQNFLQKLLECFYKATTGDEKSNVKVLSSQSLGMSEFEKLRYVIEAKNNQIIDQARAISIITGKNYIDSVALAKLQKLYNVNSDMISEQDIPEENIIERS